MTDEHTGYPTENVVPITALDQSTIDALWDELRASLHGHDAYGAKGCARCRAGVTERRMRRVYEGDVE